MLFRSTKLVGARFLSVELEGSTFICTLPSIAYLHQLIRTAQAPSRFNGLGKSYRVVYIVEKKLAPRLKTLAGMRIGILDNNKEFADLVLSGVAAMLQREYSLRELRVWRKSYLGIPAPFTAEMAAGCDAVINGVGH